MAVMQTHRSGCEAAVFISAHDKTDWGDASRFLHSHNGHQSIGLGCLISRLCSRSIIPLTARAQAGCVPYCQSRSRITSQTRPAAESRGITEVIGYQCDVIICATFITGRPNILIAKFGPATAESVDYLSWCGARLPALIQ